MKSVVRREHSPVIYLSFKYIYRFFTKLLKKCSIFTDDIELKIYQYKSISSILIQLNNQRCAQDLSVYFNFIQSILLWDAVVSLVVRGQAFVMSLQLVGSRTDCQVEQLLAENLCESRKTANCCNTNSILSARCAG